MKTIFKMIQRIQSIFFLLCAGFFGGAFTVPFATTSKSITGIFSDQMYNLSDHIALQILAGLGIAFSLGAIFLYKNRKNQIKLGYVITTVAILLPLIGILIYMNETKELSDFIVEDGIGIYLPIGTIITAILATRFVKKDEQLVASMDRLR